MSTDRDGGGGIEIAIAATEAERERCYALRYRVFVEERGHRPASADHLRKLERSPEDVAATLFSASVGGEVVGTVRLHEGAGLRFASLLPTACELPPVPEGIRNDQVAMISRFAIDARHRGGGTVVILMRACFAFLTSGDRDVRLVLILAFDQPALLRMYGLLGFHPLEPPGTYATDLGDCVLMAAKMGSG